MSKESSSDPLNAALLALHSDLLLCQTLEQKLRGHTAASETAKPRASKAPRKRPAPAAAAPLQSGAATEAAVDERVEDVLNTLLSNCKQARRQRLQEQGPQPPLTDEALSQYTRFTDGLSLGVYSQFLHYVPRLVNIVTER